jgi:hypothetical protein
VAVLLWEDHFILCDRATPTSAGHYKAFRFCRDSLNEQVIATIQSMKLEDENRYHEFFTKELPGKLGFYQGALEKKLEAIEIPKQMIGNCSWMNTSGIILPLLVLYQYRKLEREASVNLDNFDQIKTQQKVLFSNWESFQRFLAMQGYLDKIGRPARSYAPDFCLLSKAISKNYPVSGIDERIMRKWTTMKNAFSRIAPLHI